MIARGPRTLSIGSNNTVIALSETEAGKLYYTNTRSEIGSEARKMQYANAVNDLVVAFKRIDIDEQLDAGMLVMERLYSIDYRAYEYERRELWIDVFEDELTKLHVAGFVHRDLRRPSDMPGLRFDNIFLTDRGLRLIDVGISALREEVGERLFDRFVKVELEELEIFREYLFSR